MSKSVIELIFKHGNDNPNKIAIIDGNLTINYEVLSNKIYACKIFLEKMGIKKDDIVIIPAIKNISFVYCYFGVQLAQGIPVPIDHNIPESRLKNLQIYTKAKFTFNDQKLDNSFSLNYLNKNIEFYIDRKDIKKKCNFPLSKQISEILFTSGTTGSPKGVVLTHGNHLESAKNINASIGNTFKDIEILAMPLNHSFGLGRLRSVLALGGSLILMNGFLKMKNFFKIIENHKVTGFGMVPSAWSIIDRISNDKLSKYSNQIKYIELGSAPMSIKYKKKLMKILPNTKIFMHYGLTEASRSTFLEFHSENAMINTNGKSSSNVKITIRNKRGSILGSNIVGEICIEGKTVTEQYFNDMPLTKKSFWDRSFRTGDIGSLNNNGYLLLTGRISEMINISGRSFSPIEVENHIKKIDGIKDCACIGVEDPISGETLKAFLVSENKKPCIEEIVSKLKSELELYKIPVKFDWLDKLPYTSNGKLQRHILKKKEVSNND